MAVAVRRAPARGFWLWYGVTSGPLLWMVHITGVSAFASGWCAHQWEQWGAHLLTVVTGGATAAALWISYRVRRASVDDRYVFLGWLGLSMGGLSLLLILIEEAFIWTLRGCG